VIIGSAKNTLGQELLKQFKCKAGYPRLLITSLPSQFDNRRGEIDEDEDGNDKEGDEDNDEDEEDCAEDEEEEEYTSVDEEFQGH